MTPKQEVMYVMPRPPQPALSPKPPEERKKELASVFDRMVDANLGLIVAVRKLVQAVYLVLAFQVVLLTVMLYFAWNHR